MRLRIRENIKSQKTVDQFMPLVDYYLAGTGGTLTAVLKTALHIDILKLLHKVDTTRDELLGVSSRSAFTISLPNQLQACLGKSLKLAGCKGAVC